MTNEYQQEEQIRAAVQAAVERLEGPDRGRLARIEARLLATGRRPRPRRLLWAMVGAGLAAGAAAAYWSVAVRQDGPGAADEQAPPPMTQEGEAADASRDREARREVSGDGGAPAEDENPIIYIGQ